MAMVERNLNKFELVPLLTSDQSSPRPSETTSSSINSTALMDAPSRQTQPGHPSVYRQNKYKHDNSYG